MTRQRRHASPRPHTARRAARLLPAAVFWLVAAAAPVASPDASARLILRLADHGQALVNPSMGWTMHFYANIIDNYGSRLEPSDTLDDWPGLSTVYLRVPWSFLEPKEGQFNWSLL